MGHACNSSCSNYFEKQIPDTGVKYTGPAIPALGICTGDYLSEVDAVILQKLIDYSTGVGIRIPSIDPTQGACAILFADCVGCCNSCTDLPCLLECYKTAICTLYDDVKTIQDEIGPALTGYNTACLTGVNSSSLLNQVLQELITEFCALVTAFNVLDTTVTGFTAGIDTTIGNFLATAITSCSGVAGPNITRTGTGASTQFSFNGFVPVGAVIPYAGSQANFPGGYGVGPLCGWVLANGGTYTANGITITSVNMMGQVPVGLTTMGGTLPSNATGLSVTTPNAIVPGSEATHTLIVSEVPAIPIGGSLTDPGHNHAIQYQHQERKIVTGGPDNYVDFSGPMTATTPWNEYPGNVYHGPTIPGENGGVVLNKTGITLDGAVANGGGGAHNNMQPSTGLLYIQRMF